MRILDKHTDNYLQTLSVAIRKDPASLEHWRCLHIPHTHGTPDSAYEKAFALLQESLLEIDGDVIFCPDKDVLIVSRVLPTIQLQEVGDLVVHTLGTVHETPVVYDLFLQWHETSELMESKVKNYRSPQWIPLTEDAEDIRKIYAAFDGAKLRGQPGRPLTVLLVEDDLLTRRLVSTGFKEEYSILMADNAEDAIAQYIFHAPDVVFLDIGLPGKSGFSVLQQIIQIDPHAYVVMFSGNSYLDNLNKAFGAGAAGFIAKPFKKEKMRHYIEDSAMHHHRYA